MCAPATARCRPQHTCQAATSLPNSAELRLRQCFSHRRFIYTHPRPCQPAGLPRVLQSLLHKPGRMELQLGDPSSSGTCSWSLLLEGRAHLGKLQQPCGCPQRSTRLHHFPLWFPVCTFFLVGSHFLFFFFHFSSLSCTLFGRR